eukprot:1692496-Pleurochrysis_carterae.AAC.2
MAAIVVASSSVIVVKLSAVRRRVIRVAIGVFVVGLLVPGAALCLRLHTPLDLVALSTQLRGDPLLRDERPCSG